MVNKNPNYSNEYYGMSTDTKPTDALNASRFYEIDTSDVYMFDEEGKQWFKQNSGSENSDSSDSSDSSNSDSSQNVPSTSTDNFWNDPATVEYLGGIDGAIIRELCDSHIQSFGDNLYFCNYAGRDLNRNKVYAPAHSINIIFDYGSNNIGILPLTAEVNHTDEHDARLWFYISAGNYAYNGYIDFCDNISGFTGWHVKKNEEEGTIYAEINTVKLTLPEKGEEEI